MEIQLVSKERLSTDPEDIACRYTKFFDDEITIPANSKINLNSATFERFEGAYVDDSETLQLVIDNSDTLGGAPSSSYSRTIASGTYTNSQIVDEFEGLLQSGIDGSNSLGGLSVYSGTFDNQIRLGYVPENYDSYPITSSDFAQAGTSVGFAFDATYDMAYATSGTSSWQTGFYIHEHNHPVTNIFEDDVDIPGTNYEFKEQTTGSTLTPIDLINLGGAGTSAQVGGGFYSQIYAEDDTVGTGTRTNPTGIVYKDVKNPPTDYSLTLPSSFFCFLLRKGEDASGSDTIFMDTYTAYNTTQGDIINWDQMKYSIDEMNLASTVDLNTGAFKVNLLTPLIFDMGLVRDFSQPNDDYKTRFYPYIRVLNNQGDKETVFFGKDADVYFTQEFLTGLGYGTDAFKNSQLLQAFVSTNLQNTGASLETQALPPSASNILEYKFTMGPRIAQALGVYTDENSSYTTGNIYPLALPQDFDETSTSVRPLYPLSFSSSYKFESYVIRINNLPIGNFKTNSQRDQRGYKQAILATVPTPFSDTSVDTVVTTDTSPYIGSSYEPNYPHVIDLKNQEMTINRFDVEITHLKDDTQARDLYHSSINFSIIPPE